MPWRGALEYTTMPRGQSASIPRNYPASTFLDMLFQSLHYFLFFCASTRSDSTVAGIDAAGAASVGSGAAL